MQDINKINKMEIAQSGIETLYGEKASEYIRIYRLYYEAGLSLREIESSQTICEERKGMSKSQIGRLINEINRFIDNPYIPKRSIFETETYKELPVIERFEWMYLGLKHHATVGKTIALAIMTYLKGQRCEILKAEMDKICKYYYNTRKRQELMQELSIPYVWLFPSKTGAASAEVFKTISERCGKITFEFNEEALQELLNDNAVKEAFRMSGIDLNELCS